MSRILPALLLGIGWTFAGAELLAAPAKESQPRPGFDRFGDPLPPGAVARLGTVRLRHSGIIHALTFSPDGKLLASIGQFGELRLWDSATGKKAGAFVDRFGGGRLCVAFSPDGKLLASDSGIIWDVASRKRLRYLQTKNLGNIFSMQFAPDGRSLVVGTSHDKSIWFYDSATGKPLRRFEGHALAVFVAVFSVDGKRIASGCKDGTARLWDSATGKALHEFKHPTPIVDIALSADGKLLAAKTIKGVHLWEIAAQKEKRFFPLVSAPIRSLAFSPDSKLLASEGTLWDTASGKVHCECKNASGYGTAISPDGKMVAVGGSNGVISLHDAATGEELPQSRAGPNRGRLNGVRFSPDGKMLLTRGNGHVLLWDVATQCVRRRWKPESYPHSAAFSPDGKMLALAEQNGDISLWETATGRPPRRIRNGLAGLGVYRPGLVFSPDGRTLASAGFNNIIRLWRTATGEEFQHFGRFGSGVFVLHFSHDGKTLISAALGHNMRFWDVASGKELRRRDEPWVMAISPDGRWYAARPQKPTGGSAFLRICDTETGKEMCSLTEASANWCEFSPDGWSIIAAAREPLAAEQEQTLLLLDCLTGQARARFRGHLGIIEGAAFAPDGRTLASVGTDGTCLIWDIAGQPELGLAHWMVSSPKGLIKDVLTPRKKPEEYWDDLANSDAVKAFRAVRALTANAKQALPLLRQRLHPVPSADAKQIARWIADLDSDEFRVRSQARAALEKLAEVAEPTLREALGKTSSAEVRRQVRQLLQKLDSALLAPRTLQALRGIEILEHIGTAEARELLDSLAHGAAWARLTREARLALQRLR